jgi:hypothetical protein
MTYDHFKQDYARLFARNSIGQTVYQLTAMLTSEVHCSARALGGYWFNLRIVPVAASGQDFLTKI